MLRAILFFALALGVVLGGLLLLHKTAGQRPPQLPRVPPRLPRADQADDDDKGW